MEAISRKAHQLILRASLLCPVTSLNSLGAWLTRFKTWLASCVPAGLAGAFFFLAFGRTTEPGEQNRAALLLAGSLFGVVVLILIRRFRVAPWAYPLAGLLCGPVPVVIFLTAETPPKDAGGVWILSAILGLLIGFFEWARVARERSPHRRQGPADEDVRAEG